VVIADPGVMGETAGEEVHAVSRAEGEFPVVGPDEVRALGDVDVFILHGGGAAGGGLVGGGVAGVEVVPGVVADVVGALGLVDAQEVDGAALVAEADADVGAVDAAGPVGDAVGVHLAAEHADGGRVAVVGGGPDGAAVGHGDARGGAEKEWNGGAHCEAWPDADNEVVNEWMRRRRVE